MPAPSTHRQFPAPSLSSRPLDWRRPFPSVQPVIRRRWLHELVMVAGLLALGGGGAVGIGWCMLQIAAGRL